MKNQRIITKIIIIQILSLGRNPFAIGEEDDVSNEDHWIVQTNSGPVEGQLTIAFHNQRVYSFYGIPYAEPPVGNLRFKPPKPIRAWTDLFKANKKPLPCYQQKMNYSWLVFRNNSEQIRRPWSEDCLTLNIWVPSSKPQSTPVLVVFHPGTFGQGSNNFPDGSMLSAQAKNIVLSMNYRLGAFGFLYLDDPGAPGNVGLLDQQLALKWIQLNINVFGGKTQAVILVGAGNAGAASAGFHLLSPGSAGLFKSACTFNGSPLCPWAFQDTEASIENARTLSKRLDCKKSSFDQELECLRNAHPEDIVDASSVSLEDSSLQFLPTIDETFLTESPRDALKAGRINKAVILSISNANESTIPFWLANSDLVPNIDQGIAVDVFRKSIRRLLPTESELAMTAVEDFYLGECNLGDSVKIRDAAINVYSDVLIDYCMYSFEYLLAEKGVIIFRTVNNFMKESDPSWVKSTHGTFVEYVFGYPLIDDGYGLEQKNLSLFSMDWIQEQTQKKDFEMDNLLSVFDTEDMNYTLCTSTEVIYLSHYKEDRWKFWNEVIPKLNQEMGTCSPVQK